MVYHGWSKHIRERIGRVAQVAEQKRQWWWLWSMWWRHIRKGQQRFLATNLKRQLFSNGKRCFRYWVWSWRSNTSSYATSDQDWSKNLSRQIGNHFYYKIINVHNPFYAKISEVCFPPSSPFKKVFPITDCIVWSNLVAGILFFPRTIPHLCPTLLQAKPLQHSGSCIVLKELWDCSLFDATIFGGRKDSRPHIYVQFDKYFALAMESMNNLTRGLDNGYAWPSSNCWPVHCLFHFHFAQTLADLAANF